MFRFAAMFALAAVVTTGDFRVSALADEASERCDVKHNRCTTLAENAQEECRGKCADDTSCIAACDSEYEKKVKECDAAHKDCIGGDKK